MNVLQLVTTEGPFFDEQVRVLERNGVDCTTVSLPPRGDSGRSVTDYLAFYRSVLQTVRSQDFDLVHANYGLTAPMALAQPTRPVVLSLWGSDLFGTYSRVSNTCARAADEVIVMSPEMAADVAADPTVIPHGVNFDWFEPMPQAAAQREVGWDRDRRHVLFPWGEDRTVKDYPRAARVVDRADERLAEPVELQSISGVPHERMPVYMNAADALLLTSKWEGSPNSVREALACNLPVVATDVGDVRHHVGDLTLSRVCQTDAELVDALVTVLDAAADPAGRDAVRHLSLEQMGQDMLDVYERARSPTP
jgi:hypothetical protein